MNRKLVFCLAGLSLLIALIAPPAVLAADSPYIFGLLLVGPYNDHGYSQAHYEGGRYVEEHLPETKMLYIDKVNPADRPGVTIPQLVDDMVEKGAKLIIANSDDMKDGIREAAMMHPKTRFIHCSGDDVLTGKAPANLSNLFAKMIYGKMMGGFAAAMTTQTGKIGYLGPLVNEETRRLAASSYLGAKYAWEKVLGKDPADLKFSVTWIGFWFNIPGVTADPTQVAQNFYDTGHDVVISGIDTTENTVVARKKREAGKAVWAIPYDYKGACRGAEKVCLGVPYYNWGPGYVRMIRDAKAGDWKSQWIWMAPDWENINDPDSSAIGYNMGQALSDDAREKLQEFVVDLGTDKIQLFKGPLFYQDGSVFVKEGETASEKQIWYMEQLLKGMEGSSSAR